MAVEVSPIRSEADYEAAVAEIERLWGAKAGTQEGDRLDILATLVDAYESEHHPIDPPDPIEAIKFRMEQQGLTRRDLEPILGTRARVAEIHRMPDGQIHAAIDLEDGRRVAGPWTSFAAKRPGRAAAPPCLVHAYAGTVYAAQGRTVAASVLHIASATDAREVYVGLTRHTDDAWIVVEADRLDALCRRRQADPRMKPTSNDVRERLFREAQQYGEKRNVVDYVADRQEFACTGQIRTAEDERHHGFLAKTVEAARALQRALAWLRDAPIPAPAWLFLERARDRLRDLPPALRAIAIRAERTVSRDRARDRSGPDLGR